MGERARVVIRTQVEYNTKAHNYPLYRWQVATDIVREGGMDGLVYMPGGILNICSRGKLKSKAGIWLKIPVLV